MKMTGVVNFAPEPHSVELRELDVPAVERDQVRLKVEAVGVCGSDLHQWTAQHSWPVNYPVVLGHEFAGIIEAVGDEVTAWQPGDRVVSETAAVIDLNNPMTREGRYNLDPTRKGFGYGINGAMSRYVAVPARCLHRVPEGLALPIAALTEPCCVAYSAVAANTQIKPGDRVLVLGPGPIGLLCAAMARLCGAIVAVAGLPRDAKRLAIAEQYGCTALEAGDAVTDWANAGDGLGVDGVIDASGASAALQSAMAAVRPAGWITKVGWGPQPLNFSLDPLVQKNVRLQGSFSHNWPMWERVLRLLGTGMLDIGPILGGTWPLEQWHEAFETMHGGAIVKAVIEPR